MAYDYNKKLPKSLWMFYFKYAMRGHWPLMIGWVIFFLIVKSESVLFPNFQRWFIELFESPPPRRSSVFGICAAHDIADYGVVDIN